MEEEIMKQQQNRYWDNFTQSFVIQPPLEKFRSLVNIDAKILDFGCGYGRILDQLYKQGYRNLYGVDASEKMIARGQSLLDNSTAKLTTITGFKTPYQENEFDAVLLVAVLTCIPSDVEQKELVQEIRRVLKPGGVLLVTDFLLGKDERNQARYEEYQKEFGCFGVFKMDKARVVCRHHSKEHLKHLFYQFDISHWQTNSNFISMMGNPDHSIHIIAKNL